MELTIAMMWLSITSMSSTGPKAAMKRSILSFVICRERGGRGEKEGGRGEGEEGLVLILKARIGEKRKHRNENENKDDLHHYRIQYRDCRQGYRMGPNIVLKR